MQHDAAAATTVKHQMRVAGSEDTPKLNCKTLRLMHKHFQHHLVRRERKSANFRLSQFIPLSFSMEQLWQRTMRNNPFHPFSLLPFDQLRFETHIRLPHFTPFKSYPTTIHGLPPSLAAPFWDPCNYPGLSCFSLALVLPLPHHQTQLHEPW